MFQFRSWLLVAAPLALLGCGQSDLVVEGTGPDTETDPAVSEEHALRTSSTYDHDFEAAAKEFGVPAALLKAVAYGETRYEMVSGEAEFEGLQTRAGMMGLQQDALVQGAQLAGVSEEAARTEPLANIRAAAALLSAKASELNVDRTNLAAWAPALEAYSGIEDPEARAAYVRNEVFGSLQAGLGAQTDALRASGQELRLEVTGDELGNTSQGLTAGPDYAPAIWRPSPNFSSRGSYKPVFVIIHTCESAYSGCWSWLTQTRSQVSAHYVVSPGGEVSQLVREANKAWHIGASYNSALNGGVESGKNGVNVNYFSVGIEHGGFASQKTWPAAEIEASAKLSCDISKGHGIIRDRFHYVGHGKLQPSNRTDPGANWPWTAYLARINTLCGVSPPPPPPPPGGGGGGELVIDSNNARNDQAKGYIQVSANWTGTSATGGYYGTGYYFAGTTPGGDGATFFFKMDAAGTRTIDAWWTAGTNRSSAAKFVAFNAQGANVGIGTANQQVNGGAWRAVGTFNFTAGWNKVVVSRWAAEGSVVIADAIRVR